MMTILFWNVTDSLLYVTSFWRLLHLEPIGDWTDLHDGTRGLRGYGKGEALATTCPLCRRPTGSCPRLEISFPSLSGVQKL
jgi:hypothetical protein